MAPNPFHGESSQSAHLPSKPMYLLSTMKKTENASENSPFKKSFTSVVSGQVSKIHEAIEELPNWSKEARAMFLRYAERFFTLEFRKMVENLQIERCNRVVEQNYASWCIDYTNQWMEADDKRKKENEQTTTTPLPSPPMSPTSSIETDQTTSSLLSSPEAYSDVMPSRRGGSARGQFKRIKPMKLSEFMKQIDQRSVVN